MNGSFKGYSDAPTLPGTFPILTGQPNMVRILMYAFFLTCICQYASAITTTISYELPNNHVEQLGWPTSYKLDNLGGARYNSAVWKWKQSDRDCDSGWLDGVDGPNSRKFNFSLPGTFIIKCTITWPGGSVEEPTRTVAISPPSIVGTSSGIGVWTDYAPWFDPNNNGKLVITDDNYQQYPGCHLLFKLSSMGPQLTGLRVQERFTNIAFIPSTSPVPDTDWSPENGSSSRLALVENLDGEYYVDDWKSYQTINPQSGDIASYTQELRLVWTTLCGTEVKKSIGRINLRFTGRTNPSNQWQVNSP